MRKYIEKEKDFIFKNSKKMTLKEMASELHRSESSIWSFIRGHHLEYKKLRNSCNELTEREKEVLELLTQAYSLNAIADRLCIKRSTVTTHLNNIRNKYGIYNEKDRNMIVFTINEYKKKEGVR